MTIDDYRLGLIYSVPGRSRNYNLALLIMPLSAAFLFFTSNNFIRE